MFEQEQIVGTQNLKARISAMLKEPCKGYTATLSSIYDETDVYPGNLEDWRAAALAADGFIIFIGNCLETFRIQRTKRRGEGLAEGEQWTFIISKEENRA